MSSLTMWEALEYEVKMYFGMRATDANPVAAAAAMLKDAPSTGGAVSDAAVGLTPNLPAVISRVG